MWRRHFSVVSIYLLVVALAVLFPGTIQALDSEPVWSYYLSQSLSTSISTDVALEDLDGDGDLDIYLAKTIDQPDEIWINQGYAQSGTEGVFLLGPTLGYLDSRAVALGDLDGDDDVDIFVVTDYGGNQVWRNEGGGVFALIDQELGGADFYPSRDVALGDLNGDNALDAVIANDEGLPDMVWLNDGDGKFTAGQSLSLTPSRSVGLADLNGDDLLDAFVAVEGGGHHVWLNQGNGTFVSSEQSLGSAWTASYDVALGRLSQEGPFVAVVAKDLSNEVWHHTGDGVFDGSWDDVGAGDSNGVALGDINRDGNLDIVFANYAGQPNEIWLGDGNGSFTMSVRTIGDSSWSRAVALGDLNGDGNLDAVIANGWDQPDEVWLMIDGPTSVALRGMAIASHASGSWLLPVSVLALLTLFAFSRMVYRRA